MRKWYRLLAGAALLGATACSDRLAVENTNSADRTRALARPTDVEALIKASFFTFHQGILGTNTNIQPGLMNMGLESYALLANFGMVIRGAIPRLPIINTRGNQVGAENYAPYQALHRAARQAAVGLSAVNAPGFTFFPASAAQVRRARAFAHMTIGIALGHVALAYDSGAAVNENDDPTGPPLSLIGYDSLMRYAISKLDSAIAIAPGMLDLGTDWINGQAMNANQLIAFAKCWRARFRANVGRTPAERAAADWTAIRQDAADCATAFPNDFAVTTNTTTGWTVAWPVQHYLYQNWHQMWQFMVGMADTSGAYDAWLATPLANRTAFLVRTPDRRFPSGDTRGAQQAASNLAAGYPTGTYDATGLWWHVRPYFRNRLNADDVTADPWASSQYDFYRTAFHRLPSGLNRNGPHPLIMAPEMDLLQAEAEYRAGNFVNAARLINRSRITRGGLRGVDTVGTTASTVVPGTDGVAGSAGCVPRVPNNTATASACGTLFEALKWEMRMETAFLWWGAWYFYGRGWGDLPTGTALHFPVPYQELDARRLPIYSLGGLGGIQSSGPSNYGIQ